MLSDTNIRKINNLIEEEVRDMWRLDHEEKMAAIERIAALKSILDPAPTAEQIANALKSSTSPKTQTHTIDLDEIIRMFRRS
jgi:uncharacterized protein YoaH (UPF0181 family)